MEWGSTKKKDTWIKKTNRRRHTQKKYIYREIYIRKVYTHIKEI